MDKPTMALELTGPTDAVAARMGHGWWFSHAYGPTTDIYRRARGLPRSVDDMVFLGPRRIIVLAGPVWLRKKLRLRTSQATPALIEQFCEDAWKAASEARNI